MTKTLKIQFFIQIVKNKFSFNQIIHLDKKLRSLDYWPIDLHLRGCPHRAPAPPLRTRRPGSGVSEVLSVAGSPLCPDSQTACSPNTRSSPGSVGSQSPDTYRPTHTQIMDNDFSEKISTSGSNILREVFGKKYLISKNPPVQMPTNFI